MAAVHYSLEVARLEGLSCKIDATDLYFKVTLDKRKMTGAISKNTPWTGLETVTFSSLDLSSPLIIRVKKASKKIYQSKNAALGHISITIGELLEKCTGDEVPLELKSETPRARTSTVHLRFKQIDLAARAELDIKSATKCIDRIIGSANNADLNETVGSCFQVADSVVKVVDKVTKASFYLNVAWLATSALYRVVSNQIKDDKNCVDMVESMAEAFRFAQDVETLSNKTERLTEVIGELLAQTVDCCRFVEKYTKPRFLGRTIHINRTQKINEHQQRFVDLKSRLDMSVGLHTAVSTERMSDKVDMIHLERTLQPSLSDTTPRPRCLSGTRTEYLDRITDWFNSPGDCNVLWLKGIAGCGKSTIAAEVRDRCDRESRLAAYIFFERGKDEYRSTVRTIAYQLAEYDRKIGSCIVRAVERDKHVSGASVTNQFEALLLEPLKTSSDSVNGPILVILDALDECGTVEQRREILQLLKTDFAGLPTKFRFLVTSRPEDDIMQSLSRRQHIRAVELDHTSEDSRRDVSKYMDREMHDIFMPTPDDLDWDSAMKALCDAADGLFIWASTAVKMIRGTDDPLEKLEDLLRNIQSLGTYGLDDLYAAVLQQSGISWENANSRERFTRILGLVLFAKESLTCEVVDGILGLRPGKSYLVLKKLGSVVYCERGRPIRIHHASFGDYLTSCQRSGEWFIDDQGQKGAITTRCFDIMDELLYLNICNFESSFLRNDGVPGLERRIKDIVPLHLFYACRFWAEHLCEVPYSSTAPDTLKKLSKFAFGHLLYWFEVLSLTGNFSHVASRSLYNAFVWTPTSDGTLSTFLWDAYKLASTFALPISQSVPHIYLSALSLRKGESVVADHYSKTHPLIPVQVIGTKLPDACIKIFKGHRGIVSAVAVSADGKLVASGSWDNTVRIWDAESGEPVLDALTGHSDWVTPVSFSPDGKLLGSGSKDQSVRVWSTESGELVSGPLLHESAVQSVAFSSNGKRIVSGCHDGSIRVWEVESGELVLGPLAGHRGDVVMVAFLPGGEHIISCAYDSIQIWDASSGGLVSETLQERILWSAAVSLDGKRVVGGSCDGTIRVWDTDTGKVVLGPFQADAGGIRAVAFSSNGEHILSRVRAGTIIVWNAKGENAFSGPFQMEAERIWSVSFFTDGKRVVSGCRDGTVRIWAVQGRTVPFGTFDGHKTRVTSVAFSPDSERIVSGSSDNSICVWDVKSGGLVSSPLKGHTAGVTSVAFSPDGQLVVSGSEDRSVRVWNANTGAVVWGPLDDHASPVNSVAVSYKGKRIVSGSDDKTVRVWDAETRKPLLGPLEGHKNRVCSVAISLDGRRIVSGSRDESILVWDAERGGIALGPLKAHTSSVTSVAFSNDGTRIVSGSDDRTIRVWNAENGELISEPFEGHTGRITSVALSPTGKYVASCSDDRSIRLWDVESGALVSGPFYGHTKDLTSVAYSPDGRHIASGSDDRTIRIWNVAIDEVDANSEAVGERVSVGSLNAAVEVRSSNKNDAFPTSTLPKECTGSNWEVSEDGWIRGDQGELLIWIPDDTRRTLWHPYNSAILNCQYSTKLNLAGAPLGEIWCKGYPLPPSDDVEYSLASEELTMQREQEATTERIGEQELAVQQEEDPTGQELAVQPQRLELEHPSVIAQAHQWLLFLFNGLFRLLRGLFENMASA